MTTQQDVHCLHCNSLITDPDFRVILCQEEYEEIDIGPFCEECMARIKICSGCQRPFRYTDVKHVGNGDHYCASCLSTMKLCGHCGKSEPEENFQDINGTLVCRKCFSEKYFFCNSCNTYHLNDRSVTKTSLDGRRKAGIFRKYGPMVCVECFERRSPFFKTYEVEECRHCGETFTVTDPSQKKYCERCWGRSKTCDFCGKREPSVSHIIHEGARKYSCSSCVSAMHTCDCCGFHYSHKPIILHKKYKVCIICKDSAFCKNCGTLFSGEGDCCSDCRKLYVDNICECGRVKDFAGYCRVCERKEIYNYSTKPKPYFNYEKEPFEGIFFGFENEVTYGDSSNSSVKKKAIKEIYNTFDPRFLLLKSDSTISGEGFEIVSQPMDLSFFNKTDWSVLFNNVIKSKSCGLHVHVDRKSFISDIHLYKICNIIYKNPTFREYIAGRGTNSFCTTLDDKVSSTIKKSKRGNAERYQAVNLRNKNTVEFRLFAGCVTEQELRQRVEILVALIVYMKNTPISQSGDVKSFVAWVGQNKRQYPNGLELLAGKYKV